MLCVEDNSELRNQLQQQFLAEGFDVEAAEDGDVALKMLGMKNYDIVLLDLKLPRRDGIAVLKELKNFSFFPKVVMLTAVNDVKTAMECVRLGAKDYISKPYDPEDLLHVVIKVLGA